MKGLLKKELLSIFCSPIGISFSFVYLLLCGAFLWIFPGAYNIPDSGYASLDSFFGLSSLLLLILVPALTMRSFAEERKGKTIDLLFSRPIGMAKIVWSKILSAWLFIVVTVSTTFVFFFFINHLALPADHLAFSEIFVNYISLFILSLVLVSLGVFASTLTANQIVALIVSLVLNVFIFYGFDLLSNLFRSGKTISFISSLGLSSHYELMRRGVIRLKDVIVFINYIALFSLLSVYRLQISKRRYAMKLIVGAIVLGVMNLIVLFLPNYRADFTVDKRYTLSDYSVSVLEKQSKEKNNIQINLFLEGDLNPGFQRLQNAVKDILLDFNRYSGNNITVSYVNPYELASTPKTIYELMGNQHMDGIVLNETDREGKVSQKIIYPYAQVISGNDTLPVDLLKNVSGNSAEENLNLSIENLEFQFIDAVRLIANRVPQNIAFIEGHGELSEAYLEDATAKLSKYYFVNRGQIIPDITVLNDFKAVIIAGPTSRYSEQEKFVLDQYIMNGGRVLWLIDGVYYSAQNLETKGESASMKNETNLDDMLFTYGLRVNSVLLQDAQCAPILLASGKENDHPSVLPFYFSPLLIPSQDHPVTKGISAVKSSFASSVDLVGKSDEIEKTVLLTTSDNSHTLKVPEMITFDVTDIQSQPDYFNEKYLMVAVSMQGRFRSVYANRMPPDSVNMHHLSPVTKSKNTKMIVVGCSDIIRNEIIGHGDKTQILPMGYDRVAGKQYGNSDFIVNAVNWLVNDDDWLALRNKEQKMRLLDKTKVYENRDVYVAFVVISPLLLLGLLIMGVTLYRKCKYEKK
ncbi:MAG: gliding motility-associated ABC transporter substrate-binding protein GldG [Dysgonomonas sp.]